MTTYSDNLRIPHLDQNVAQPEIPENTAKDIIDQIMSGRHTFDFTSDADMTITQTDNVTAPTDWQNAILNFTSSVVLTGTRNVILPTYQRTYILENNTGYPLTFYPEGGTGVVLSDGNNMFAFTDGVDLVKLEFAASGAGSTLESLSDTPSGYGNNGDVLLSNGANGFNYSPMFSNLVDDTTPQLGGSLETLDNPIVFTDGLGVVTGVITKIDNGIALAYTGEDGVYEETDGGIALKPGVSELHGSNTLVSSLASSSNNQVYCSPEGTLYAVAPPEPGWEENDSDNGDYDLDTLGAWVNLTGLSITIPEDVPDGDRIDITANVHMVNNSGSRAGSVAFGWGVNGVDPSVAAGTQYIEGDFDGLVPTSMTILNHGGLSSGDTINVFAQRSAQDHNAFAPVAQGSVAPQHSMLVSIPGLSSGFSGSITAAVGEKSVDVNTDYGNSGPITLNLADASVFTFTPSGATSITINTAFTNTSFTMLLTNGGTNMAWATPIAWQGGVEPTWSTSGDDLITFNKIGALLIGGALIGVA